MIPELIFQVYLLGMAVMIAFAWAAERYGFSSIQRETGWPITVLGWPFIVIFGGAFVFIILILVALKAIWDWTLTVGRKKS